MKDDNFKDSPCESLSVGSDDIGFLIWQIMKSWQRGKIRLLDEFELTSSQMETLSAVYHLGQTTQEVTQIAISNFTLIDPMTTSTVLRNLEKKHLIVRKSSKIDTRARIVMLTQSGEDLFVRAVTKVKTSTERVMQEIGDEEALKNQLKILLEVINRITDLTK